MKISKILRLAAERIAEEAAERPFKQFFSCVVLMELCNDLNENYAALYFYGDLMGGPSLEDIGYYLSASQFLDAAGYSENAANELRVLCLLMAAEVAESEGL